MFTRIRWTGVIRQVQPVTQKTTAVMTVQKRSNLTSSRNDVVHVRTRFITFPRTRRLPSTKYQPNPDDVRKEVSSRNNFILVILFDTKQSFKPNTFESINDV